MQILVSLGLLGAIPEIGFVTFFKTVLTFLSVLCPGQTAGPIFALYASNDVFPCKEVPFGGWHDG